jgi:riboflavin kinase/FMN adenylyltransferase
MSCAARPRRLLGYPTLNVALPEPRKLLPPEGVYAVRVQTPSGEFGGMLNLGRRPTFGDERLRWRRTCSTPRRLVRRAGPGGLRRALREVRRFDAVEALVEQLRRDEGAARDALR